MAGSTLPERIAQLYYSYGLLCSSFPYTAIILAISVLLFCCYPLLNVPLPGNIPTIVKLPLSSNINLDIGHYNSPECKDDDCVNNKTVPTLEFKHLLNETNKLPYLWTKEKPHLYVQQIILKTGVSPWNSNLRLWDAFRGPIQEAFRLLETVRDHVDPDTKTTLARLCYQIDNIKRRDSKASIERVLPEYSCLLLSPANLWQQNLQSYTLDNNIINTIYNYQNLHRGKVSIAEMAFGMNLKDAGIKRYPLRSRPRVLQFAVTIFYEQADEKFVNSLNQKLKNMYPLYHNKQYPVNEATLIYYPGQFNYVELVPLIITFCGLFIYIYFSVRKIEFIKSKLGLATCAVITIGASLAMSMGLCLYFGFSLSLQIFPYLVILVGLENVLVITKSVTSTDSRLDFKIRLAQGLSKEGWSITKNLLTEITIFTLSFFTFVPFIQEVSIFMIVSLVSDFFIQMVFFATILGIDLKHMEHYQDQNDKLHLKEYFNANTAMNWQFNKRYFEEEIVTPLRMTKSKSHPRLNGLAYSSPTDVVANRKPSSSGQEKVPKRIRLVNLWARTRFFQRAFMIWMVVWITMIVYNCGVVEYLVNTGNKTDTRGDSNKRYDKREYKPPEYHFFNYSTDSNTIIFSPLLNIGNNNRGANETSLQLKHTQLFRPWTRLTPYHWSSILSQYNESLSGRYIMVLPPLLLSCPISPEIAISLRNPEEKDPPTLRWQALAAALDPIDMTADYELIDGINQVNPWSKTMSANELPIYPTTPMEILLLAILCVISIIVITYMVVVLYRCICTRNYAEWRASWTENDDQAKSTAKQPAVQLVMQAVPLILPGHNHEIECVVTDGERIVSTCLQGTIKIWDSQNGDLLNEIDRQTYFKLAQAMELQLKGVKIRHEKTENNSTCDADEVGKVYECVPRLRKQLKEHLENINFTNIPNEDRFKYLPIAEKTKYNFARSYREFYYDGQYGDPHYAYDDKIVMGSSSKTSNKTQTIVNGHDIDSSDNICKTNNNRLNDKCFKNDNLYRIDNKMVNSDTNCVSNLDWKNKVIEESPIWCMDYCNDLIILGCADGRLEFWEVTNCKLMCVWWNTHGVVESSRSVTQVRAVAGARRVCVAALSGHLMMLRLDAYNPTSGVHVDWSFSTAHRRTHKRTGSAGSIYMHSNNDNSPLKFQRSENDTLHNNSEEIHCARIAVLRAHQQPITELHIDGGRILTGGQDHILKVFLTADLSLLFTLHGHCGPITSCFIDHFTPTIGGSGSQDGLLSVWDLHTGSCIYSIQAHDGAVTSLNYTTSYVISAGADERLCIWDRFQGHMLNSINVGLNYMSKMLPLTHTLLLMGDRSGLTVYDLSNGDIIRRVILGERDSCIIVRQILPLKDAIVCDYANELCIVRFPLVNKLSDMKCE